MGEFSFRSFTSKCDHRIDFRRPRRKPAGQQGGERQQQRDPDKRHLIEQEHVHNIELQSANPPQEERRS
jgi:hypothetical protein